MRLTAAPPTNTACAARTRSISSRPRRTHAATTDGPPRSRSSPASTASSSPTAAPAPARSSTSGSTRNLGTSSKAAARERAAPSKLVCLESYWNDRLFHSVSVRGFLEALRPALRPPQKVAHRFVESKRGLAYYTKRPRGSSLEAAGSLGHSDLLPRAPLLAGTCHLRSRHDRVGQAV